MVMMMRTVRACRFRFRTTREILSQTNKTLTTPLPVFTARRHDTSCCMQLVAHTLSLPSSSVSRPLEKKNDNDDDTSRRSIHSASSLLSSPSRNQCSARNASSSFQQQMRRFTAKDHEKKATTSSVSAASTAAQQQLVVLSHRDKAALESRLIARVGNTVHDEILQQPLSRLGWLSPRVEITSSSPSPNIDNDVMTVLFEISLSLPNLLHPELSRLKHDVQLAAEQELAVWLKEQAPSALWNATTTTKVQVKAVAATPPVPLMARLAEDPSELLDMLGPGLANVAHFVAVYSCKGGVGKSTVAVNLAYQLARAGGRIGLLVSNRDILSMCMCIFVLLCVFVVVIPSLTCFLVHYRIWIFMARLYQS
jgi:NUBPL iron-transfer P-loop NTPase